MCVTCESCVLHVSHVCYMCVTCVTCLIDMCDVSCAKTHPCLRHDSSIPVTWVPEREASSPTRFVSNWDVSRDLMLLSFTWHMGDCRALWHMWHDTLDCRALWHTWHDTFHCKALWHTWHDTFYITSACATWHMPKRLRDMTHSTSHVNPLCTMTHSTSLRHVRHDCVHKGLTGGKHCMRDWQVIGMRS